MQTAFSADALAAAPTAHVHVPPETTALSLPPGSLLADAAAGAIVSAATGTSAAALTASQLAELYAPDVQQLATAVDGVPGTAAAAAAPEPWTASEPAAATTQQLQDSQDANAEYGGLRASLASASDTAADGAAQWMDTAADLLPSAGGDEGGTGMQPELTAEPPAEAAPEPASAPQAAQWPSSHAAAAQASQDAGAEAAPEQPIPTATQQGANSGAQWAAQHPAVEQSAWQPPIRAALPADAIAAPSLHMAAGPRNQPEDGDTAAADAAALPATAGKKGPLDACTHAFAPKTMSVGASRA